MTNPAIIQQIFPIGSSVRYIGGDKSVVASVLTVIPQVGDVYTVVDHRSVYGYDVVAIDIGNDSGVWYISDVDTFALYDNIAAYEVVEVEEYEKI